LIFGVFSFFFLFSFFNEKHSTKLTEPPQQLESVASSMMRVSDLLDENTSYKNNHTQHLVEEEIHRLPSFVGFPFPDSLRKGL
jgi:hypothetical protein